MRKRLLIIFLGALNGRSGEWLKIYLPFHVYGYYCYCIFQIKLVMLSLQLGTFQLQAYRKCLRSKLWSGAHFFLQIRESLPRCGFTGTAVAFKAATLGACCEQCDEEDTALFSNLFICTSLLQLYPVLYPSGFSDTALDYIDLNSLKISFCLMLLQVESEYKQS